MQLCRFSSRGVSTDMQLVVAFPKLRKPFDDHNVQRRWTDQVVNPAMKKAMPYHARPYLPGLYDLIKMKSQAERNELSWDVADNLIEGAIMEGTAKKLWDEILKQIELPENRDETSGTSEAEVWKSLEDSWKMKTLDPAYIPLDTMEIRIETEFRVVPENVALEEDKRIKRENEEVAREVSRKARVV